MSQRPRVQTLRQIALVSSDFYLVAPVRMYLVDGIIGDQPRYIWD